MFVVREGVLSRGKGSFRVGAQLDRCFCLVVAWHVAPWSSVARRSGWGGKGRV